MNTESRAGQAAPENASSSQDSLSKRIAELERKLEAKEKTIVALKKRVLARDESATSPLAVLEQNIALGKVVALKTRELSEERRELQETLDKLGRTQAMLLQAQKMESIGQLAAGIAHEINTPTQYVRDNLTFVHRAKEGADRVFDKAFEVIEAARAGGLARDLITEFDELVRRTKFAYLREEFPLALEQSLEGMERISSIVAAMKEFSHPSAGEKEAVDLRALIETTATVTRNEWKYVAELETDFDDDVPPVPCLRDEIGQVVLNLVVNATHAISDTLKTGEKEKGRITIRLRKHGSNFVDILVVDDGDGIPEAIRNKIFNPFFTTKGVGKGTGQGLAIAYSTVVDKHQGQIFFETEVGVGTTFIVRLPISDSGGD
jgi:two-component system NtrC family sensor kinase